MDQYYKSGYLYIQINVSHIPEQYGNDLLDHVFLTLLRVKKKGGSK